MNTCPIAETLRSTSIRHRSDAKESDRCQTDVDLRVFAIWDPILLYWYVEVWAWMIKYIPWFSMEVFICLCPKFNADLISIFLLVKEVPDDEWLSSHQQYYRHCLRSCLTHWGRDKIAANLRTTFSNAFLWMEIMGFRLTFVWSLFFMAQPTINQPDQAIIWTIDGLVYWHIYAQLASMGDATNFFRCPLLTGVVKQWSIKKGSVSQRVRTSQHDIWLKLLYSRSFSHNEFCAYYDSNAVVICAKSRGD